MTFLNRALLRRVEAAELAALKRHVHTLSDEELLREFAATTAQLCEEWNCTPQNLEGIMRPCRPLLPDDL